MAEDNQNADMEDILSSIKNILEEDEHERQAVQPAADDVLGDVLNSSSEVDDILELSPDMRVDAAEPAETVAADASGTVLPADTESSDLADFSSESTVETRTEDNEGNNTSDEVAGFDRDSGFAEAITPEPETEALPEDGTVAEFEPDLEPLAETEFAPEPTENEPEPVVVTDSAAEPAEAVEAEVAVEPEIAVEPEVEARADSAVDVSANIISNFAKMFAHDEPAVSPAEPVAANITAAGDTSKTLEEFVLEAIVKVIGREITAEWNRGAEFRAFAEEEIVRQTKEWLNDNLPSLVEKVVKQEIERVIAKVGS